MSCQLNPFCDPHLAAQHHAACTGGSTAPWHHPGSFICRQSTRGTPAIFRNPHTCLTCCARATLCARCPPLRPLPSPLCSVVFRTKPGMSQPSHRHADTPPVPQACRSVPKPSSHSHFHRSSCIPSFLLHHHHANAHRHSHGAYTCGTFCSGCPASPTSSHRPAPQACNHMGLATLRLHGIRSSQRASWDSSAQQ